MDQTTVLVLVLVGVLIVGFVLYQRQQAELAAARARTSAAGQIGAGVGSLLSGILGAAGVS